MSHNYLQSNRVVRPNEDLIVNQKRLNWTPALHDLFISAIQKLGGPREAKPTALKHQMEKMGANGITIRHVKSHLQKYRNTHKSFQRMIAGQSSNGSSGSIENPNNPLPPPPPFANMDATGDHDDMELDYLIHSPKMEPLPLASDWEKTVDPSFYYDYQSAIQIVPNDSFLELNNQENYSISLLPKEEDYNTTVMIETSKVQGLAPNCIPPDNYLNSFWSAKKTWKL